jgi:L-alanine-DL-glutamate epimerase-like enolase superfamily enzyme
MTLRVATKVERWPITGSFVISRGARTEATVVVAEVSDGKYIGRGECVPYRRYDETEASVVAAIEAAPLPLDRAVLRSSMPAGAARNALDCALWDLEAKRSGTPVWKLAGLPSPRPLVTCYTISLGDPETMAKGARAEAARPILKLKLGGQGDPERVANTARSTSSSTRPAG